MSNHIPPSGMPLPSAADIEQWLAEITDEREASELRAYAVRNSIILPRDTIEQDAAHYIAVLDQPASPAPNTSHFVRMSGSSRWGDEAFTAELDKQFAARAAAAKC